MPTTNIPLTGAAIGALESGMNRKEISFTDDQDNRVPGLRLFLSASGGRTFYYTYQVNRKNKRIRIAEYQPDHFDTAQRPTIMQAVVRYQRDREEGKALGHPITGKSSRRHVSRPRRNVNRHTALPFAPWHRNMSKGSASPTVAGSLKLGVSPNGCFKRILFRYWALELPRKLNDPTFEKHSRPWRNAEQLSPQTPRQQQL